MASKGRLVTIDGETKNISQWCKKFKVSTDTFYLRLKYGWEVERALTTKPDRTKQRKRKKEYFIE